MSTPPGPPAPEPDPPVLVPEPAGLTSTKLAARLSLSDETIRNYARAGMQSCGKDHRGVALYDPAYCQDWIRRNRPKRRQGGKREGAGRKPDDPGKGTGDFGQLTEAQQADKARKDREREEAFRKIMSGQVRAEDIPLFAVMADLTPEQCEVIERTSKAARETFNFRKTIGKYRLTEEVERETRALVKRIRDAMARAPGRIAVAAAAVVGAEHAAEVRRAVEKAAEVEVERILSDALSGEKATADSADDADGAEREAA